MTVQGPGKEQQPDGLSHRGITCLKSTRRRRQRKIFLDLRWSCCGRVRCGSLVFLPSGGGVCGGTVARSGGTVFRGGEGNLQEKVGRYNRHLSRVRGSQMQSIP